jgi:hypothetical protein
MPPHPLPGDVELFEFPPGSDSPRGSISSLRSTHRECEPLIARSSSSPSSPASPRPRAHRHPGQGLLAGRTQHWLSASEYLYQPGDDGCLCFNMEKASTSKARHFLDKIAVESEPGLTNIQMMLTNHDLKPVEPERRQWGAWNYVGFWVGTLSRAVKT